jgi:hypothetical protein
MRPLIPRFAAQRMLRKYVEGMYVEERKRETREVPE